MLKTLKSEHDGTLWGVRRRRGRGYRRMVGKRGTGKSGLKVMYLVRGIESQRGEEEALTVCDLG